jgi:hypothetical protein
VTSNLISLLGMAVLLALAWAFSSHRRLFPRRTVLWGLGLQLVVAVLLLRTDWGRAVFSWLRGAVVQLLAFTDPGAEFIFGPLFRTAPQYVENLAPGTSWWQGVDPATGGPVTLGIIFAFHVLPIIIFFCSLIAILYHLGVMQRVIQGMAWVMQKTMKTSGAETLSVSANIFVGQTEAPIVIRPYLKMGLPAAQGNDSRPLSADDDEPRSAAGRLAARCWALLLARIYECLPLLCPRCGQPMRIIAFILDPPVIERILTHVGEPVTPPAMLPARAPPQEELWFEAARPLVGQAAWTEIDQTGGQDSWD